MDFIIYFCICICAIIIFALYIRKIIKPYKQREKNESVSSSLEMKTEFKTDEKEIIKLEIPQEMYDGLEIGQSGEVTLVEWELYSFIIWFNINYMFIKE